MVLRSPPLAFVSLPSSAGGLSLFHSYMNSILLNNTYYQALTNRDHTAYTINKYLLSQDLISNSYGRNESDIYFTYSVEHEDFTISKASLQPSISNPALEEYIRNYVEKSFATDWTIIQIQDMPFLFHMYYSNQIYFGSMICLSPILEDLAHSLNVDSPVISIKSDSGHFETDDSYFSVDVPFHNEKLHILCSIPKENILQRLSFFQRHMYSIALAYLLLLPALFLFIYLFFRYPMQLILHAMNELKEGNQDYRIPAATVAREFQEINTTFNLMSEKLKKLKIENYEQQLAYQQVELDNLQLTIRPHFLQNILGNLYTLCQMGETEQMGCFILYLADYFRYIYQNTHKLTSFSSELSLIRQYIDISYILCPKSFEIVYDIAEDISDVYIPPLLIHNFIENIMSHALKRGKFLHILLKLEKTPQTALFTISDDGIGIPEDIVREINLGNSIPDKTRIHVGLHNSWLRIEKTYHGQAEIYLDSKVDVGTTIHLSLPLNTLQSSEESL